MANISNVLCVHTMFFRASGEIDIGSLVELLRVQISVEIIGDVLDVYRFI